ncbi:MAG: hypothetical protein JW963_03140 [Anaerolineales bacterium]|nr:hypothetical protein [Anaerolineales bacterium]
MSEEKDRVNNLLFDFELHGLTNRQKEVLSEAFVRLLDDATRKRDALEVVNIQRMQA